MTAFMKTTDKYGGTGKESVPHSLRAGLLTMAVVT